VAYVWFGMVLAAAFALSVFIRRRYSPRRTRRRLLVPVALVERACVDALEELRGDGESVFTSTFEPACAELSRISWADVAALGPQAAASHRVLVRVVDHWNANAGSLRASEDVAPLLSAGRQAAAGLMGSMPVVEVEATRGVLDGQMLRSIVALPPPPTTVVH
jgi:hypothetical protein